MAPTLSLANDTGALPQRYRMGLPTLNAMAVVLQSNPPPLLGPLTVPTAEPMRAKDPAPGLPKVKSKEEHRRARRAERDALCRKLTKARPDLVNASFADIVKGVGLGHGPLLLSGYVGPDYRAADYEGDDKAGAATSEVCTIFLLSTFKLKSANSQAQAGPSRGV